MTQTQTTTSQVPQRITCTHYTIQGETHPERIYDLTYENGRWNCNCPDKRHNHNPECKHRRALIAHIQEQLAEQQARSQAAEIIEEMQRAITSTKAKIEEETDDLTENFTAQIDSLKRKHAEEIEDLQQQIENQDALLNYQEKENIKLQEKLEDLQGQIDYLNKMTNNNRLELEKMTFDLTAMLEEMRAYEAARQAKPKPTTRKPRSSSTKYPATLSDVEEARRQQERESRERLPLNGNKPFSLMR